jgi:hypothetical protein
LTQLLGMGAVAYGLLWRVACRAEAEFVLCLYKHMLGQVAELQDGTASVAVISPYKAQVGSTKHSRPMSL